MLTLGVPGSGTTAVMIGALTLYNITPGPLLFEQQPDVVWGLIASLFIGNVILLIMNIPRRPVLAHAQRAELGAGTDDHGDQHGRRVFGAQHRVRPRC